MRLLNYITRAWRWLSPRLAYDPMNAAGKMSWALISAGAWCLWGHAVAMIVAGALLGGWYVYLELYLPSRVARPKGDN